MDLHGSQITTGSINVNKLNIESVVDALTSQVAANVNTKFSTTIANLRQRWAFAAQYTVMRAVAANASEPWKETSKTQTVFNVDVIRLDTAIQAKQARDTGNVDLTAKYSVYMFPANDLVPSTEDLLTWGGDVYRIVSIQPLGTGNTPQLYILGLV